MPQPQQLYDAIARQVAPAQLLRDYADGNHPQRYSTEKLKRVFGKIDAKFIANFCELVIAAIAERITLHNVVVTNDSAATELIGDSLLVCDIENLAGDVHYDVLVTGRGCVTVWAGADGSPTLYYNRPEYVRVLRDAGGVVTAAAKCWLGESETTVLEHYTTSVITRYERVRDGDTWHTVSSQPNPYGIVPIIEFSGGRDCSSVLSPSVLSLQDAINKVLSDSIITAEFAAYPQKWVISSGKINGKLVAAPDTLTQIPPGSPHGQPSSVGQFAPADMNKYIDLLDKLSNDLATISRVPKPYLLGAAGDLSGEAVDAMESQLSHRANAVIARLTAGWRAVALAIGRVAGIAIDPRAVTVAWGETQRVSQMTRLAARKMAVEAGTPLLWHLQYAEHYTPAQLDSVRAYMQEHRVAASAYGDALLAGFNAGSE